MSLGRYMCNICTCFAAMSCKIKNVFSCGRWEQSTIDIGNQESRVNVLHKIDNSLMWFNMFKVEMQARNQHAGVVVTTAIFNENIRSWCDSRIWARTVLFH